MNYTNIPAIFKPPTKEEIRQRNEEYVEKIKESLADKFHSWKYFDDKDDEVSFNHLIEYIQNDMEDSDNLLQDEAERKIRLMARTHNIDIEALFADDTAYAELLEYVVELGYYNLLELINYDIMITDPKPFDLTGGKNAGAFDRKYDMIKLWHKIGEYGFAEYDVEQMYNSIDGRYGEFGMGFIVDPGELFNPPIKGRAVLYFIDRTDLEPSRYIVSGGDSKVPYGTDGQELTPFIDRDAREARSIGVILDAKEWRSY